MPSRRQFIEVLGSASIVALLGGRYLFRVPMAWAISTQDLQRDFVWLTASEAKLVERLTAAIIPSGKDIGAAEIGAVHYIDHALKADQAKGALVRKELARLSSDVDSKEDASALLVRIQREQPALFAMLRALTIDAYYNSPKVWPLIGYPGPACLTGGYPESGVEFNELLKKQG
ncbi:MAG: gluconate 2-dehydrogenase subunit 3 family protein [Acidobacteria bacterium]|nr:gluconate 2-dehydrogenase subunit 3 family protein [Acidobacteriota bacterium]